MVTYELIEELQKKKLYKTLLKKGIISTALNYKKYIYEVYRSCKNDKLPNAQVITNTAELSKCSEGYIYKVIKTMES